MYSCGWYGDDLGNKKALIHAKHELSKADILGYLKELPYMTEGASPIAGVIFDSDGEIITSRVIGGKSELVVPDYIFEKILALEGLDYQIDRYLFSKRDLEDGCTLIVIMDVLGEVGELDILFIKPEVHSKGLGYLAWCQMEKLHPEVKVWETV